MSEQKIYLNWNDPSVYWSGGEIDYVWKDVFIIIQAAGILDSGGGIILDQEPWKWLEDKVDKKVADRFKKIVIRVNDLEKTREKDKEIKVTVDHIKNTFKQFGVNVKINSKSVELEESPVQNSIDEGEVKKSVSLSIQPRVTRRED
jgi:alcohol dehydrogenase YqhD (iron-dependent ADH family)